MAILGPTRISANGYTVFLKEQRHWSNGWGLMRPWLWRMSTHKDLDYVRFYVKNLEANGYGSMFCQASIWIINGVMPSPIMKEKQLWRLGELVEIHDLKSNMGKAGGVEAHAGS